MIGEGSARAFGPLFDDRVEAGQRLGVALSQLAAGSELLVLALPRGGVPIARGVAAALRAQWELCLVRKVGVPGIPEVALGAIAEGDAGFVEEDTSWYLGVPQPVVATLVGRERRELERRAQWYRDGAPRPELRGRTVCLVDDGLASGATLRAAAKSVRERGAARIIAAVPIAWGANAGEVGAEVDDLVAIAMPEPFGMVSDWYRDFSPVSDDAVLAALGRRRRTVPIAPASEPAEALVHIQTRRSILEGDLGQPDYGDAPHGLVILAHGGGSSRGSWRNRYLAGRLRLAGWATLRVDLLTEAERPLDRSGALRFDVRELGGRLEDVAVWCTAQGVPGAEKTVLMGASTGAAAAMIAAAARPGLVAAIVSRAGRVDLAEEALRRVRAPSLLIVGATDRATLRANRKAIAVLPDRSRVVVIPSAGHTFEEPGTLGQVGEAGVDWLGAIAGRR